MSHLSIVNVVLRPLYTMWVPYCTIVVLLVLKKKKKRGGEGRVVYVIIARRTNISHAWFRIKIVSVMWLLFYE